MRPVDFPHLVRRGKAMLGGGDDRALVGEAEMGSRRNRRWPWWILGFLLGVAVYLVRPGPEAAGAGPLFWAILVFAIGVSGLLLILMLLLLVRPRQGRVAFALKMARSGRVDWAIADIQNQIERRGPSPERTGALGDCYLLQEDWRQAYIHYLEAERIDGRKGRFLAKQGFSLWKLGRGIEAAALLEQASANEPLNPSHAWTSCLILADLGRYDDAREHLRKAELLLETLVPLDATRRRALEESIEVCRRRLAQDPGPPLESS